MMTPSSSMDPRLVALLRGAVANHLADKGVPREQRPELDFKHAEDLLTQYACRVLALPIAAEYKLFASVGDVAKELNRIVTTFPVEPPADTPDDVARRQRLREAFNEPFLRHAHRRLRRYLEKCWGMFQENTNAYPFPYVAIVQSSGFGKSRTIKELARICAEDTTSTTMNVLYVCARDSVASSGYPLQTTNLKDFFFPTSKLIPEAIYSSLADRLVAVFHHIAHSSDRNAISKELLTLFDDRDSDSKFVVEFRRELAGTAEIDAEMSASTPTILVLAVDEARSLLSSGDGQEQDRNWFRQLRRALSAANETISQRFGAKSAIFALLVDTNSKISNFAPSRSNDFSQRFGSIKLFPSFVLTDSMDIFFNSERLTTEVDKYQQAVRNALVSEGTSWKALRCMGRPLWMRGSADSKVALIELAATKLLGGVGGVSFANFVLPENLYGVASALCRLGIRPYASTPFASRAVAEFMAVLAYIGYENDQIVCSYSSDPMLTLGATKLWYYYPNVLANNILPQLRELLHQEVMDTGGSGELVACILLLLAMDACGEMRTGKREDRWKEAGEFSSVWTFLTALHGESPTVRKPILDKLTAYKKSDIPKEGKTLTAIEKQWTDWYVSFTQFVQLEEEPKEACLWAMLGRRVAGVLPRGQNGADLVIPIVKKTVSGEIEGLGESISVILVQVKNIANRDSKVTESSTTKLAPGFVFDESPLRDLGADQVMRIYLSLRGYAKPTHSYAVDLRGEKPVHTRMLLGGLDGWSSQLMLKKRPKNAPVEVVAKSVAKALMPLLEPWWNVTKAVESDLDRRNKLGVFGMQEDELVTIARRTLVDKLVLNDAHKTPTTDATPSTSGGDEEKKHATASERDAVGAEDSTYSGHSHPRGEGEEVKTKKKKKTTSTTRKSAHPGTTSSETYLLRPIRHRVGT